MPQTYGTLKQKLSKKRPVSIPPGAPGKIKLKDHLMKRKDSNQVQRRMGY